MNPDLDDPNNHVPPVTSGDEWGDLDEGAESPAEGMPAKRPDRGIPPKKSQKSARVNHHAPKLKLHADSTYSPLEPRMGTRKEDTEATLDEPSPTAKPVRKERRKSVGKSPRKKAKAADESVMGESASTESSGSGSGGNDVPGANTREERVVLPAAQSDKRFRVNEITPARETVDKRALKMVPKSGEIASESAVEGVARSRRRRFVRGERGDWGAKAAKGSLRWMVYTGVGVVALVVVAVVLSRGSAGKSERENEQSFYSQIAPDDSEQGNHTEDPEMMGMLTKGQDEAKRIFGEYAAAKNVDDFLGLVYRAEENGNLIGQNWEPLGMGSGWKPGEDAVWTVLEQEGMRYGVLQGSLPNFSAFRAYFRHEGERLKMDWRATAGYCSADFAELKKGQGDGGEIRALVSPADFHTFALPEGVFRSFRLMSPDGEENLWAYTKIGGELDGKLISQFMPSQITGEAQSEIAVVLELQRGPDDSLPNQWMITRLVRLSWLDQ